jgi:DNA-binding LacI/PurR family transcriptional regulator
VGLVSMALPFDDRWFFAEVLRGARAQVEAAGHRLCTHVVPPSPDATLQVVREIERDFADPESLGAIVVGFKYRSDQRDRALAFERPVVVVGGSVMGFPTVMIDDIGASRAATDHLLALGHRRITHFAGELDDQMDFSVHGRRARGYRLAMEQAGLEPVIVEVDFDDRDVRAKALRCSTPTIGRPRCSRSPTRSRSRSSRPRRTSGWRSRGTCRWSGSTTTRERRRPASPRSGSAPTSRAPPRRSCCCPASGTAPTPAAPA